MSSSCWTCPSSVCAVTYEKGAKLGEYTLRSPKGETKLQLSVDCDGEELVYLMAELCDEAGTLKTGAEEELTAAAEGAELLGFGSGDPKPGMNYNTGRARTYKGRAQLILKKRPGEKISVSVSSTSGKTAQISL